MQEKLTYEYSIIRVVPKVEREEFVNIGLIMFCKRAKFLKVKTFLHTEKILLLNQEFDIENLCLALASFEKIINKPNEGGVIASYDLADKFRWLTAVKSSCLQTSKPRIGISDNPEKTFDKIYIEMVI